MHDGNQILEDFQSWKEEFIELADPSVTQNKLFAFAIPNRHSGFTELAINVIKLENVLQISSEGLLHRDHLYLELPKLNQTFDYLENASIGFEEYKDCDSFYFSSESPIMDLLEFMPDAPSMDLFTFQQPTILEPILEQPLQYLEMSECWLHPFEIDPEPSNLFLCTPLLQNEKYDMMASEDIRPNYKDAHFLEVPVAELNLNFDFESMNSLLFYPVSNIHSSKMDFLIVRAPDILCINADMAQFELPNILAIPVYPFNDTVIFSVPQLEISATIFNEIIEWKSTRSKPKCSEKQFLFENITDTEITVAHQKNIQRVLRFKTGSKFIINFGLLKNQTIIQEFLKHEVALVERDFGNRDHQLIGVDEDNLIWLLSTCEILDSSINRYVLAYGKMYKRVNIVLIAFSYHHKVRQKSMISKMDIQILMNVISQYDHVSVVYANEVDEILQCIGRVSENSSPIETDEEMSANERFLANLGAEMNYFKAQRLLACSVNLRSCLSRATPSETDLREDVGTEPSVYDFGIVRPMMYGFGDDPSPRNDSVDLVEDMVVEYLTDILLQANKISKMHGGKFRTDDILFVLRKDPKKYARVEELLFMNEELKRARKAFDVDEEPERD